MFLRLQLVLRFENDGFVSIDEIQEFLHIRRNGGVGVAPHGKRTNSNYDLTIWEAPWSQEWTFHLSPTSGGLDSHCLPVAQSYDSDWKRWIWRISRFSCGNGRFVYPERRMGDGPWFCHGNPKDNPPRQAWAGSTEH